MLIKSQQKSDASRKVKQHTLPQLVIAGSHESGGYPGSKKSKPKLELKDALLAIKHLETRLQKERESRYQEGFEAGQRAGYQQGRDEINLHLQKMAAMLISLRAQQHEVMQSAKDFILSFSLKIVEKILGAESVDNLELSMEKLSEVVIQAVAQFDKTREFVFRVHPESAEIIRQYEARIQSLVPEDYTFKICNDHSLKKNEFLIECDYGALDARLQGQLDQIKHAFSYSPEQPDVH